MLSYRMASKAYIVKFKPPADRQTAEHYYDRAGGDPDAARAMAAKGGVAILNSRHLGFPFFPRHTEVTENDQNWPIVTE
jgi:hypothetical protein